MNFQLPKRKGFHKRTIAELQSQSMSIRERRSSRSDVGFIMVMVDCSIRPKTCQWIDGEPRQRMFCNSPTRAGSSYCEAHHSRCYVVTALTRDEE